MLWMKWLGRAALALLLVVIAGSLAATIYAFAHRDAAPLPVAQAVVVISGPGGGDDPVLYDTRDRVLKAVDLWKAGAAPLIVVSGNGRYEGHNARPDSERMRELAELSGVPAEAIVEEGRSYSTLQNAVYTAQLAEIDPAGPILLVTSRFHLARAWASFRWAGFTEITLIASDATGSGSLGLYAMEGPKWIFNVTRAGAATIGRALGVPDSTTIGWLE